MTKSFDEQYEEIQRLLCNFEDVSVIAETNKRIIVCFRKETAPKFRVIAREHGYNSSLSDDVLRRNTYVSLLYNHV